MAGCNIGVALPTVDGGIVTPGLSVLVPGTFGNGLYGVVPGASAGAGVSYDGVVIMVSPPRRRKMPNRRPVVVDGM